MPNVWRFNHCPPRRKATIETGFKNIGKRGEIRTFARRSWECPLVGLIWKTVDQFLQRLNVEFPRICMLSQLPWGGDVCTDPLSLDRMNRPTVAILHPATQASPGEPVILFVSLSYTENHSLYTYIDQESLSGGQRHQEKTHRISKPGLIGAHRDRTDHQGACMGLT